MTASSGATCWPGKTSISHHQTHGYTMRPSRAEQRPSLGAPTAWVKTTRHPSALTTRVVGWFPDPRQYTPTVSSLQPPQPGLAGFQGGGARAEICRSFNENRCKYTRCRFQHICLVCAGPHPATTCPRGAMSGGLVARNRAAARGRQSLAHPYLPGRR